MSDTDFDFSLAYRVHGYHGIAFRADDYELEPDDDTWWTGLRMPTGRILAHMIGDDRTFTFDPEDMTPITDMDYCSECGQIGCKWGHS